MLGKLCLLRENPYRAMLKYGSDALNSLERLLQRRRGMPGTAQICLVLVVVLVLLQSIEVSASLPLMTVHGIWSARPFCFGMIATLAGFAMARERADTSWRVYAVNRFGVVPVFVFTILTSAFVLGPAVSSLALRDYFGAGGTYAYLLNLVGLPQFTLPGVFEYNDFVEAVNENVWIAPFYVILAGAAGIDGRRKWLDLLPFVGLGSVVLAAILLQALGVLLDDARSLPALVMRGDGLTVLAGGAAGIAAFRYRPFLRVDGRLAVLSGGALAALVAIGNANWLGNAVFRSAAALPLAYLAIYLALRRLPGVAFAKRLHHRYLTGLFLFSFPMQQLVVQLGPRGQGVLVNTLLAAAPTAAFAIAFWHLVTIHLPSERQRDDAPYRATPGAGARGSIGRSLRRLRPQAIAAYAALVAALVALVLGLLAMVYFALLHD